MLFLRIYLFLGLVVHKAVWELLKRQQPGQARDNTRPPAPAPLATGRKIPVQFIKAVKIVILLGVVIQTFSPQILPISSDPSILRVVGVFVYTTGLLVAISGRLQLGQSWSDIETARVLSAQAVVAKGLYRYVRHPIYVGDLLLLLGLELSLNSWLVVGVLLLAPPVIWQALREEKMLVQTLSGYEGYCAHTKRFIPFLI